MRLMLLLALLGGCVIEDTVPVSATWRSEPYGGGGSCYTALGGEDVHVSISYEGGQLKDTFDCTDLRFTLDIPDGATRVVIDVYGDSGPGHEGNTHREFAVANKPIDLGAVSIE